MILILSLLLLTGCGSATDLEDPGLTEDPETGIVISKKDGKDKITVDTSRPGQIRFLGEIESKSQQKACFINISFVTRNADNEIIDQGQKPQASLIGTTLSLGGDEHHDCLDPSNVNKFGSFDTGYWDITDDFDHYEFRICEVTGGRCSFVPFARPGLVQLDLVNLQVDQNSAGKRVFSGFIRNSSPDPAHIAYDVSVTFTILDKEGNVIDTKRQSIETQTGCKIGGVDFTHCLRPGQEFPFAITTDVQADVTCETGQCFYYRIHHSE